jgi:hypothetical protein
LNVKSNKIWEERETLPQTDSGRSDLLSPEALPETQKPGALAAQGSRKGTPTARKRNGGKTKKAVKA